ncbi:phospholipase/lecithinase/hemolysin [Duganella sp. SG902]|uniref:SGNH/GDSL hydrolase family protein n=1 Tax=Duganella sp. SG902 TaxID=2587016 RepID=UPI00159EA6DD|nr:SGNH/GDSL hydrolase family protein [Duganella sp. SG902]NVM78019.1 phospholipase/lecithinase/hemolysin [Duganella sp. SG902]
MRHTKFALAAMALAVLAGCGGTDPAPGNQSVKVKYSAQVSFGDSLSDVGSYAVGTVAALKGGKFTINGDNTAINPTFTGKNWTELLAAQIGVAAPCAAVTGLDGDASKGFSVPAKANAGCYGYAMGGSRVTNPVGPNNKLTGSALGALTYPVATQIANHLKAVGGKFKGDELVLVMAGGNDALFQLGALSSAATAAGTAAGNTAYVSSLVSQLAAGATSPLTAAQAIGAAAQTAAAQPGATQTTITQAAIGAAAVQPGNSAVASPAVYGPMVTKATADATAAGNKAGADYAAAHGPELVTAMAQAGTELVALVKNQLIANGANFVVVNNLPDVATTPAGRARDAATQALINAMVAAFNTALSNGLSGEAKVLLVDVFAVSHDQATNPGPYGLTNVSEPACDLSLAKNPLGSSLTCNGGNLKSGDVSHWSFADDVHPTPYNNLLLARYVSMALVTKGWL